MGSAELVLPASVDAAAGDERSARRRGTPDLVLTRTPLRVSFAGGGTDLPDFYEQEYGAVLSMTIDQYLYVTVKRHGELFSEPIRLNYSETEQVQTVEQIRNAIARECLRFLQVEPPIYISTIADLPEFSGLGSSSSFAVGLLNALHTYRGERVSAGQLADEASHIEIDVLKRPIGKQDHYAAAYGGLNLFCFRPGGRVTVETQRLAHDALDRLFAHTLVFWTGITRDAGQILAEQQRNTPQNLALLQAMRGHAEELQRLVRDGFNPLAFGDILDATWTLKRQLAHTISTVRIDAWYEQAKRAGAIGGKICGAGGGGFLLLVMPPERRDAVRQALAELREIRIAYEAQGSRVLWPVMP